MSNPSLLCVPYRFKTSKLYSQIPDSGLGDFTVTRSASNAATRVNAAGLIETVADNVPRLDYPLGGITAGCPALLVEPSARNSILQSADSASGWTLNASMTRATIDVIGVSGVNLTVGASGSIGSAGSRYTSPILSPALNLASGSTYTISFLAKKTTAHTILGYYVTIAGAAAGDLGGGFDVSGSFNSGSIYNSAGTTNRIRRVEQWGTDVFRCSETFTMTASGTVERINLGVLTAVNSTTAAPIGTTIGFAAPQLELGSVPTSFIPTTTAAITRGAEVVSKTGISSLIGQTEGSIYAEVNIQKLLGTTQRAIVDIGQSGNRLFLGYGNGLTNQIRFLLQTSLGGLVDINSSATSTGTIKIAVGYKNNDSIMYVNGVSGTFLSNDSFTSSLNTLTGLYIGSSLSGADFFNDRIRALELYPTRLPNTGPLSLQSLTQ